MYTVERSTIAGATYLLASEVDLAKTDRPLPLGHWCGAAVTFEGAQILVRATESYTCNALLNDFGTKFTSQYSLANGSLELGSYLVADADNDEIVATHHVAKWEHDGVGIFTESIAQSAEWMADFLAYATPEVFNRSPIFAERKGIVFSEEANHLALTLYGVGVADLRPALTTSVGQGFEARAGQLFKDTANNDDVALILETSTASMRMSLLQVPVEQIVELLANHVDELSFRGPTGTS